MGRESCRSHAYMVARNNERYALFDKYMTELVTSMTCWRFKRKSAMECLPIIRGAGTNLTAEVVRHITMCVVDEDTSAADMWSLKLVVYVLTCSAACGLVGVVE